jgi:hypothetical protein
MGALVGAGKERSQIMNDTNTSRLERILVLVVSGILLISGVVSAAIGILILALALYLTIIGWEWQDGPIIWSRVAGIVSCPLTLGALLIALAIALIRANSKLSINERNEY